MWSMPCCQTLISTHTPLAGCDLKRRNRNKKPFRFQLTHPSRGATVMCGRGFAPRIFQLTHPSRGATYIIFLIVSFKIISTHTPLAGCDVPRRQHIQERLQFQLTHPSRGATVAPLARSEADSFQLTHPSRGATGYYINDSPKIKDFNSHTPRGVRLYNYTASEQEVAISTHTPLAGCDFHNHKKCCISCNFNSHTPRGVRRSSLLTHLVL